MATIDISSIIDAYTTDDELADTARRALRGEATDGEREALEALAEALADCTDENGELVGGAPAAERIQRAEVAVRAAVA